ncbi:MAG: alpha/beta fold hydrolase [Candidatus Omnitrophica bacterium]|nr:alpha/beta fold hydrolase [Candidatus Omnitrophota bacterium]
MLPSYPVIFIPGLGYTGTFWEKSQMFKELRRLGWKDRGIITVSRDSRDPANPILHPRRIKPGHIYTMTFSGTQIPIVEQGKELAAVVAAVKKANATDHVILVGHSMGGLAAREYLQSPYYQNDAAGFISVGTPHQGSNFELKKIEFVIIPKVIRDLVWDVDTKSAAVRDLRPRSIYLSGGNENNSPNHFRSKDVNANGYVGDEITGLNNFKARPLPDRQIIYDCVIGSGDPIIATREQSEFSDGIVKIHSQDLNLVPGVNVHADVYHTTKDHFGEVNDSWVLMKAIDPLLIDVD